MKKILSTALAIALFVGAAQAQKSNENGRARGDRQEMRFQQLNLTPDQQTKLQSIREAQRKEVEALRKNDQMSVADMKSRRKEITEKYKAQYESLLTPAQMDELKKRKPANEEKGFGNRGGGERFGNQAAFFQKDLNLSAEQETRIKNIFQDFRTKSQSLRSDNSLSQDQKKAQMRTLSQQYMNQAKAVLTPEQVKKLNDSKGKHQRNKNANL